MSDASAEIPDDRESRDSNPAQQQAWKELCDKHVRLLMEHFDTVQILVSKSDPSDGITGSYETGAGNFFARQDQARKWLIYHDEGERIRSRRENSSGDD